MFQPVSRGFLASASSRCASPPPSPLFKAARLSIKARFQCVRRPQDCSTPRTVVPGHQPRRTRLARRSRESEVAPALPGFRVDLTAIPHISGAPRADRHISPRDGKQAARLYRGRAEREATPSKSKAQYRQGRNTAVVAPTRPSFRSSRKRR